MENQVFGTKWDSGTWESDGIKDFKEKAHVPLPGHRQEEDEQEKKSEEKMDMGLGPER